MWLLDRLLLLGLVQGSQRTLIQHQAALSLLLLLLQGRYISELIGRLSLNQLELLGVTLCVVLLYCRRFRSCVVAIVIGRGLGLFQCADWLVLLGSWPDDKWWVVVYLWKRLWKVIGCSFADENTQFLRLAAATRLLDQVGGGRLQRRYGKLLAPRCYGLGVLAA